MSDRLLKGAIIGFGGVGESFAVAAAQDSGIKIIAACDVFPARLSVAKEKYGLETFADHKKLYSLKPDLVIISSTNAFHKEHVLLAAKNGAHILCEKPIALTMKDAFAMVSAVKKAGVVNIVNYSFRYTKRMNAAKAFVDSGRLGRVLSVWTRRSRGAGLYSSGTRHWAVVKPELSGGWCVHHASHSADLLRWFGGKIKSVYARMHTTAVDRNSEEIIWAMTVHENGVTGIMGDSITNYRDSEFGVVGDKGTLFLDEGQVLRFKPECGKESWSKDDIELIPVGAEPAVYNSAVLKYFLDHVRKGKKSEVDISEAAESLKVCLAMKRSAKTGKVAIIN